MKADDAQIILRATTNLLIAAAELTIAIGILITFLK